MEIRVGVGKKVGVGLTVTGFETGRGVGVHAERAVTGVFGGASFSGAGGESGGARGEEKTERDEDRDGELHVDGWSLGLGVTFILLLRR